MDQTLLFAIAVSLSALAYIMISGRRAAVRLCCTAR